MENKAVEKPRTSWPGWYDRGWMAPIDEFFNMGRMTNVPAVNVSETDRDFRLSIAAPGMDKNDFRLEAYDDLLTISAEREKKEEKEEKNGHFNRREYNYSSWSRSFTIPENCDTGKIDAAYVNGELKITIPKLEVKHPRKIKSIAVH